MDRINKIGRSLIGYKGEYSKHYSPIVDESLMISLETQVDKKILDQEIFDLIINDSYSLESFEKFIANKREYVKSPKELLEEFEKVRAIVNESLAKNNFTDFIETESNTEINKISILKQYTISEEFIKIYFGLDDSDMAQIMKKKGFAEKFAVLRLTKVFKEIFSEMRQESEFSQGFSRVYYNNDVNGFSIDYKYHLNVDFITKENIDTKIKKIRDTDRVVERKFLKKMGLNLYNLKPIQNANQTLDISKASPNNKFSEVKVEEKEVKEIKNQIKEEPISQKNMEEPKKNIKIDNQKPSSNNTNEKNKQNNKPIENNTKKIPEDYLSEEINEKDKVIEIMDEIGNIKIEEDTSGDFSPENFEGFIPDEDLDVPEDIEMPDEFELDNMKFDSEEDDDL